MLFSGPARVTDLLSSTDSAASSPGSPPPGWYPDPWGASPHRYWDGAAWTGHTDSATAYASVATTAKQDPLRMILPIGRSAWAIAAGYLGLFSVLFVFAPFALIAGVLGLREIKRKPDLMGAGRAWFGVIMGALFSILLGLAILANASN